MLTHWLTFGLSNEQEERFRQNSFNADRAQAGVCMLLLLLPIVGYAVNDYFFFGFSWWFYGISAWRLGLLGYTLLLLQYLKHVKTSRAYDKAVFVWELVTAITIVGLAGTRPHTYFGHILVAMMAIFFFQLIIPNRFLNQLLITVAIILGEAGILMHSLHSQPSQTAVAILLTLFVMPIVILASWQFHLTRRQAFAAAAREREAEEHRVFAEAGLRELTQRLTYHVDNSPLAVIEWGADMRLIRWSSEA